MDVRRYVPVLGAKGSGPMSFLSRFDAVLFDLNGTLAEGFDRFGNDQDYHATYTRLGGNTFSSPVLRTLVEQSLDRCLRRYEQGPWDPFPAYSEFLEIADAGQKALVEDVVAEHELGTIANARLEWLRRLSRTHGIGLVTDVWAPSRRLLAYLRGVGLDELLGAIVISSDEGAVKPSRRLFDTALDRRECPASRAVFVGDNLSRDVGGAQACGIATVWIGDPDRATKVPRPNRMVSAVEELSSLE